MDHLMSLNDLQRMLGGGSSSQQSHSVAAVAIADEKYEFFPTTDDDVLAVPKDGPKVSVSISAGKGFYSQLSVDFYDAHDGTKALSDKAVKEAVGMISGRVRKLPKIDAHLRVAEVGEETFLDLGDESGRCVRITAEGWTVEEESPVLFRRTNLVAPLPVPERGSDLKEFFNLTNIPERSKALYLGFLVSFYFPNIAHPILAPLGPQGSGKSKASEHTHRILDNSPILGRKLARSATGRDLVLRSDQAAFLGVHDWFIGSTVMSSGVPEAVRALTKLFPYGDLSGLEELLQKIWARLQPSFWSPSV